MQKGPISEPRRRLQRLRSWRLGWGRPVALAILLALLALRAWDPIWLEVLRHRTFDSFQQLRPRLVTQSPVVIVDIDEKSLAEIGQWPWPRTVLATLVDKLAQAGTAVIGLDVILAEPDRMSPALLAKAISGLDEATAGRLADLPSNETVLAGAMRRTRVVLAQAGQPSVTPGDSSTAARTGIASIGGDPRPLLIDFPGLLRNRPELEAAAAGRGLTTFQPDRDGVIRRVPAVMVSEGRLAPAFAIEMLRVAAGASNILVRRDAAGVRDLVVAGVAIPTDSSGQLWLHHSRHMPARFVSASDVLRGQVQPDRLRGKLALVGSSSVALFDLRTTPLERVMPAVELQAQVIENILTNSLLTRPHNAIGAELVIAALAGLAVILLVPMLGALPVILCGLGSMLLLAGSSWYLFDHKRVLVDFAFPLMTSALVFLFLTFQNYVREERRRSAIRSAFAHYLAPVLVERLADDPGKLKLGGETRLVTLYRSDLAGFSGISELHGPDELVPLMNEYLSAMTDIIMAHGGFVDKYIGDGIDGIFGAPVDDPQQALRAVEAALAAQAKLAEMNEEAIPALQGHRLRQRIGLHTGDGLLGNIGSRQRFNYTVMGDSANLASRLESANKIYGTSILVSEPTRNLAGDSIAWRELDVIRVVGRHGAVRIFEPLARATDLTATRRAHAEAYANGLARWRARDFAGAAQAFAGFADEDPPAAKFLERCQGLIAAPPDGAWEPVHQLESK